MMHGYLVFDQAGTLLTPFRTWRNTTAGPAAARLTEQFQFNIPERWSIAHLYQAILDGEVHVPQIDYMTHVVRLHPLAADGEPDAGYRRRLWHVPHRFGDRRFPRRHDPAV